MIENDGIFVNDFDSESSHSPNEIINNDKLIEKQVENKKPNKRKQTFERKNIRYIIDEEKFGKDAKEAQRAEFERLKRVQEKEQNVRLQSLLFNDQNFIKHPMYNSENFNGFNNHNNNYIKLAPARLPPASVLLPGQGFKKYNSINKQYRVIPDDSNVIYVDDSDDDNNENNIKDDKDRKCDNRKTEVIEISDGDDGDADGVKQDGKNVGIVDEDEDDNNDDEKDEVIDQEKLDILNVQRDKLGRIVINKSLNCEEDGDDGNENLYYLSPKINATIKPHQVSGIRFLYDNLVESKTQFKEADGFGCILAHSMGLGKTIQIIGFLDVLFRFVNATSALVIVPINTIQNWKAEFDYWLPTSTSTSQNDQTATEMSQRPFTLFVIRDTNKTIESRHAVIKQWMEMGGVLLIGYEMFRLLVTYRQSKITKPKRKDKDVMNAHNQQPKRKICIDIELEEKRDAIYQDFLKALVNPGPEIVICDEGHRIKNSEASISKALKAVRTHRRVVMTGYPLQNNLTEYWCMVDFVRPNYLGSKHEFNNMFQRPIENGQCVDSTFEDRKLMQGRAHVLHELLEGFVQRRSHAVLKANLPPKWEYVILVRMSPLQRKLYSSFMNQLLNGSLYNWAQNNTLRTYAMCCKIWNHPDILFRVVKEQKLSRSDPDFDFDIDDEIANNSATSTTSFSSSSSSTLKLKLKNPKSRDSKKSIPLSTSLLNFHGMGSSPSNSNLFKTAQATPMYVEGEPNEDDPDHKIEMIDNDHQIHNRYQHNNKKLTAQNLKSIKDNSNSVLTTGSVSTNKSITPAHYMSYSSYLESVMINNNINSQNNNGGGSGYKEFESNIGTGNSVDPYGWVGQVTNDLISDGLYQPGCKEHSGKIVIFLSLLEECISYGDKMLVFSQSLLTLDLIELFLKQQQPQIRPMDSSQHQFSWERNRTYFRLDGSTSATERERMIKLFNEPGSEAYLFLLSTRAGCLGINLIGANRVVVFDASWNPCHDCQAVCRVYRYGQNKPCFIYRLVTDNTIEKKIYDRQVTKQGISDRVVDESNPGQQFTRSQVQVLVQYEDIDIPGLSPEKVDEMKRGCGEEDPILGRILEKDSHWVTKVPFTHESLLIDRKDYRLTRSEKRKAKERYELDKRQSLYYQKNSYSDYYIKTTVPVNSINISNDNSNNIAIQNRPPFSTSGYHHRSSILPSHMAVNPHPVLPHNFNLSSNTNRFLMTPTTTSTATKNYVLRQPSNLGVRHNAALLREIEQARLRYGFTKSFPGQFPISISDDDEEDGKDHDGNDEVDVDGKEVGDDESALLRKKVKFSDAVSTDSIVPKSSPVEVGGDLMKNVTKSKIDSSSDSKSDKMFKVVKITATTELDFPMSSSVVNSQAGVGANRSQLLDNRTKIVAGESLEVICTSKGKFLRVSRTGELFAIKDSNANGSNSRDEKAEIVKQQDNIVGGRNPENVDCVDHQLSKNELITGTHASRINNSYNSFNVKEPVASSPPPHTLSSFSNIRPNESIHFNDTTYPTPFVVPINGLDDNRNVTVSTNGCFASYTNSQSVSGPGSAQALAPSSFINLSAPSQPISNLCCNCKLNDNKPVRNCICYCHNANSTNKNQSVTYSSSSAVLASPSLSSSHLQQSVLRPQFPNNSQLLYNQHPSHLAVPPQQFTMNSLSNAYCKTLAPQSQFGDNGNFTMTTINNHNNNNNPLTTQHTWSFLDNDRFSEEYRDLGGPATGGIANDNVGFVGSEQVLNNSNNVIYSGYESSFDL